MSVVIPAFNAERFLDETVRSVLTQTLDALEVIVVDDGSIDRTLSVARSIVDPRVRVLSGPNGGLASARNRGLATATAEFVAFLDSDDLWYPTKLEVQVDALTPLNVEIVASFMHYISEDHRAFGIAGQVLGSDDIGRVRAATLMPAPISSMLFRTETVRMVGGFDETLPLSVGDDIDLVSRVARRGTVIVVPKRLGCYRVHGSSVTSDRLRLQMRATRFVQERLKVEDDGGRLTWAEFNLSYRPSLRERHTEAVRARFRAAGLAAADRRWPSLLKHFSAALVLNPRYTIRRLLLQQLTNRRVSTSPGR